MRRAVIIGAGLGGLATAIRLAVDGFRVTIVEKNERVGGKMDVWMKNGYRFDTGPSLLTMPFILKDLFEVAGERLEDFLDLTPAEPVCRYAWQDGTRLDTSNDLILTERNIGRISEHDAKNVGRFLDHGKNIYDAVLGPFLNSEFISFTMRGMVRAIRNLSATPRIDAMRSLNEAVEEYFMDTRIRQLFNRFATYNGSSPYLAPATLCIIPYIEFAMGGWYLHGGMYTLACALEALAQNLGVEIIRRTEAQSIQHNGRKVEGVDAGGEFFTADVIISNADAAYTERTLLGRATAPPLDPSLAGFVLLLGVRKTWKTLSQHNVFFSNDYEREFEDLCKHRRPSSDPTIYVCNTSLVDKSHAPEGGSNLFVLVNAPPLPARNEQVAGFDWRSHGKEYRDLVINKLERCGLDGLHDSVEVERMITPLDFQRRYNAPGGSIYGTSSNSRAAAFRRPPNKSRRFDNLYFVGGSSHPGGGVPLVLMSGKIVSNMVQRDST